jgi:chromosome segregation ATPase
MDINPIKSRLEKIKANKCKYIDGQNLCRDKAWLCGTDNQSTADFIAHAPQDIKDLIEAYKVVKQERDIYIKLTRKREAEVEHLEKSLEGCRDALKEALETVYEKAKEVEAKDDTINMQHGQILQLRAEVERLEKEVAEYKYMVDQANGYVD